MIKLTPLQSWYWLTHSYVQPFTIPMGIVGLSIGILAFVPNATPEYVPFLLGFDKFLRLLGTVLFLLLLLRLITTLVFNWAHLRSQWNSNQLVTYAAAIPLTALHLSWVWQDEIGLSLAQGLWWFWALIHGVYTLWLVHSWLIEGKWHRDDLAPSWFIVYSGNFVAALEGARLLGAEYVGLLFYFYGVSLFFWMIVFMLLMNQLFFYYQKERDFRPSLFIFLAPPSLGSMALVEITQSIQPLSWVLFYVATFMLFIWLINFRTFWRMPYDLGSWAYLFPMASYIGAAATLAQYSHSSGLYLLSWAAFLMTLMLAGRLLWDQLSLWSSSLKNT